MNLLHFFVLALLMLTAGLALWFRNLFHSVIALSTFSLVLAIEFYLMQAPDVAIAEASIGAALSTTIAIIALRSCRKKKDGEENKQ